MEYYLKCINIDLQTKYPSLATKWIPRENKKYHDLAFILALRLYYNTADNTILNEENFENNYGNIFKNYRKTISIISNKLVILEKLMANNDWDKIEVKDIPSKAF